MKVKNKRSVLIVIIVLLVIFVPLAIIGTVAHFTDSGLGSSSKEFYHKGYLNFYMKDSNTRLGRYKCINKICDYAYEYIDDKDLRIYNDNSTDKIELIGNKFAFLVDAPTAPAYYLGLPITLYDVVNEQMKSTFLAVKNYTIGLENDYYIVKNNANKCGVVRIVDDVSVVIPYSYTYIGAKGNITDNNKIDSSRFVVKDDNGFKIISDKAEDLSSYFDSGILDYNDNYIAIKKDGAVTIYNYQGGNVGFVQYKDVKFFGDYVGVIDNTGSFSIIDPSSGMDLSKKYQIDNIDTVTYKITDNGIEITVNGESEVVVSGGSVSTPEYDFNF